LGCLLLKSLIKIYNIQIPTKNLVGIFLFTSMNIAIWIRINKRKYGLRRRCLRKRRNKI